MYCLIKLVSIIICILAFSSFLETIYKPSFFFLESCYFHKVSSSIIIDLLFSLLKKDSKRTARCGRVIYAIKCLLGVVAPQGALEREKERESGCTEFAIQAQCAHATIFVFKGKICVYRTICALMKNAF